MMMWGRRLIGVLLLIVVVLLAWLMATESGLRWTYQQARPYLPSELRIHTLEGKLIGPITIKNIEYLQDGTSINAGQIIFDWQPSGLLTANVDISRLHIQSLNIVLPRTEKTSEVDQALPEIYLPWRMKLQDAQINDIRISQEEQTFKLKQIRLNATTLFSKVNIKELSVNADTFELTVEGELRPTLDYRHDLQIHWQAELPSHAIIKGQGQIAGNMKVMRIKQHMQDTLQLTIDAELNNVLNQLNWRAKANVTKFNIAQLNSSWPALSGALTLDAKGDLTTATLSGNLKGQYPELGDLNADFKLQRLSDNTIEIDYLKLHAPASDTSLEARGRWMPGGSNSGDIKLALNWQNLRWPMQDPPWFNSASGSGLIEGDIDDYQIQLASDSPWPHLVVDSSWYASADGNIDGLNFHSLRVTTLKGEAVATGQLNWSPELTWNAQVNASDIDPANLWPEWPGQLNAKFTSNGRNENGQWHAAADISQLQGKLRGYPVSLRSRLNLRDQKLDIALFEFRSADSQVHLRGQAGETLKLNWSVSSNDLSELHPQTKGELRARGRLDGPWDTPTIDAALNGKALRLSHNELSYEIGAIDATIAADLFRWQKINIKLAAQALNLNDNSLQSLDINADNQHITAKAVSAVASVQLELKGESHANGWRGQLNKADIQSSQFSNWQLTTPATLNIDEKSLALNALCLHDKQTARLCASVTRENSTWRSHIETNKFPLMLFSHWLPVEMKLDGTANATTELQFQSPDQLQGQAHIKLPPGTVSYPLLEGERDRWDYRSGNLIISLNPQGLKANSEISLTNGDRFNGQLALPGANLLALEIQHQPLQASAQLNIHDLGLIEALVPEVQDVQGEVALTVSATGMLAQPKLSGRAHILNGALRIPRLGLNIEQLSMKGQSDNFEKLNFRVDARSGEGKLAIEGQTALDRPAGWPTTIRVTGDNFEVSRIPEAQILVSPDLQVTLQKNTIDIKGDVHIPYAKLQPKDISSAAHVSDDAVIVGGKQTATEKWSITTHTRLTLGERVNFYGFGFEGRLGGSLLLQDQPGQLTTATGEISVQEGRYRAYGQRLDVEHGRLLFTGGPLTNPGLDLRAVRVVNSAVTAGIKVRGSLDQPELELFSIPAMGQTDALAYLLLGRPIESTSGEEGTMMAKATLALGLSGGDRLARMVGDKFGLDEMRVESSDSGDQASLVMGRYLSPKLYVSYGVGLIEAINTLTLRYQISDKWQLKAQSGEYQGADMVYTIKR